MAAAAEAAGGSAADRPAAAEGDPLVAVVVFGLFGIFLLYLAMHTVRYRRKLRERDREVRTASAEAAEDDAYFASGELERHAVALFRAAQMAWDARDREGLARLVGPDLLVEWKRRLDDFDQKGWHNRVEVVGDPTVLYVGITNREDDEEDRAVVRIEAELKAYVEDRAGKRVMRDGEKDELVSLVSTGRSRARTAHGWSSRSSSAPRATITWTGRSWPRHGRTSSASTTSRSRSLPWRTGFLRGFTTADLAQLDFDGDARAHALELSLADARFAPDVMEAAARRAVAAWTEAVDGDDAALERMASPEAVAGLLYGGDAARATRLVVRGPLVKRIRIVGVQVDEAPATMTVELELGGRRYVEDRDTAAVVSGSKGSPATFTERWTLALDGPADAPWRIVGIA